MWSEEGGTNIPALGALGGVINNLLTNESVIELLRNGQHSSAVDVYVSKGALKCRKISRS